jgi:enediyne biosynthesis thioesterase
MKAYEYRHIVGFEETSLAGNVYYSNYVRWQGRCREMFLREYAPEILDSLEKELALMTVSVSCHYRAELFAFDEIIIRMHLGPFRQNGITMLFEYWRLNRGNEELVAQGEQQIACMQRKSGANVPVPIPASLREALMPYVEAKSHTSG